MTIDIHTLDLQDWVSKISVKRFNRIFKIRDNILETLSFLKTQLNKILKAVTSKAEKEKRKRVTSKDVIEVIATLYGASRADEVNKQLKKEQRFRMAIRTLKNGTKSETQSVKPLLKCSLNDLNDESKISGCRYWAGRALNRIIRKKNFTGLILSAEGVNMIHILLEMEAKVRWGTLKTVKPRETKKRPAPTDLSTFGNDINDFMPEGARKKAKTIQKPVGTKTGPTVEQLAQKAKKAKKKAAKNEAPVKEIRRLPRAAAIKARKVIADLV